MATYTKKWEELPVEQMLENYIRLKNLERERNKKSYEKMKLNPILGALLLDLL